VFEGLESVTRPWSSILDVTIDVSDDARIALDSDALGRFIFFDVINEAVNNAVKHGRASRVMISAAQLAPTDVRLVVTNDGDPWQENVTSGLGTLSLATITTSMHVEKTETGSALRVSLPLAPVASRDY
jgi:signal transduction histidine kinase